jgi:hypothetical protein
VGSIHEKNERSKLSCSCPLRMVVLSIGTHSKTSQQSDNQVNQSYTLIKQDFRGSTIINYFVNSFAIRKIGPQFTPVKVETEIRVYTLYNELQIANYE